jgi:hypothetical protein
MSSARTNVGVFVLFVVTVAGGTIGPCRSSAGEAGRMFPFPRAQNCQPQAIVPVQALERRQANSQRFRKRLKAFGRDLAGVWESGRRRSVR